MGHTQEKPASGGMNISVKSFITAIAMLAALMVLTYVLTFFVPAGTFERTELDGQMAVLRGNVENNNANLSRIEEELRGQQDRSGRAARYLSCR